MEFDEAAEPEQIDSGELPLPVSEPGLSLGDLLQNGAGAAHSAANTLEIYLATHLPTLPLWMGKHDD